MTTENNVVPFKTESLPHEPTALMIAVYNLPLMTLVQKKNEILSHIEAVGGEITPELEDIFDHATNLLTGKVDRVAIFVKEVIPAHIQACKDQIARLQVAEERIKKYTIECIKAQGKGSDGKFQNLEGLAWRARVQANPPSLVIDDEELVPMMFKKGKAVIEIEFDPSNAKLRTELEETCKMAVKLYNATYEFLTFPDNAEMKKIMVDQKNTKGEITAQGTPIEGAHIEQDVHVRFEPGKAKASKPAGKKKEIASE